MAPLAERTVIDIDQATLYKYVNDIANGLRRWPGRSSDLCRCCKELPYAILGLGFEFSISPGSSLQYTPGGSTFECFGQPEIQSFVPSSVSKRNSARDCPGKTNHPDPFAGPLFPLYCIFAAESNERC